MEHSKTWSLKCGTSVPEILQMLLEELKEDSSVGYGIISTFAVSTITRYSCFSFSSKEKPNIICLALTSSVPSSWENFFPASNFCNDNRWFWNLCNNLYKSVRDCKVVSCDIQLVHYVNFEDKLMKDNSKVNCPSKYLSLLVYVDDDVTIWRMFKLRATINHSGTINAGHYRAFISDSDNSSWLRFWLCQVLFWGRQSNISPQSCSRGSSLLTWTHGY